MKRLRSKDKLAIITVDYANRYNIGNYHLNAELSSRFKETKYFFLEKGFDLNSNYFKECDFIFINRPLRKTKRADIEGQYFKEIRFGRLNIPVVIYDTDTTMLTIKQRRNQTNPPNQRNKMARH